MSDLKVLIVINVFVQVSEISTAASTETWPLFPVLPLESDSRGTGLYLWIIPWRWQTLFLGTWWRASRGSRAGSDIFRRGSGEFIFQLCYSRYSLCTHGYCCQVGLTWFYIWSIIHFVSSRKSRGKVLKWQELKIDKCNYWKQGSWF